MLRFWSPTLLLVGLVLVSELLAWALTMRESVLVLAFPDTM